MLKSELWSVEEVLSGVLANLPPELPNVTITPSDKNTSVPSGYHKYKERLLREITSTAMYKLLKKMASSGNLSLPPSPENRLEVLFAW